MEAIEVSHLTFSYDGKNDILKDVSFSIPKGSYTTIIGHNGSGKSTMAKLIIGLLEAKKGKIQILGKELNEESVYELRSHVGIVFQNPDNQFIGSTVADDIAFGLENHCVEQEKMQDIIEDVASRVGMTDFLSAEPTKLSGGQKQRVAIAGILAIEPDIIIFDEPSAVLTPQEVNELIKTMKNLAAMGKSLIIVTHKLQEVMDVSDRVMIMRSGKFVKEMPTSETSIEEMSFLMVGRRIIDKEVKEQATTGKVLDIENLVLHGEGGKNVLDGLSMNVEAGEIVGIAGVSGNGQSELIECITGLKPFDGGEVRLLETDIKGKSVGQIREAGCACIPEDRYLYGCASKATLVETSIMAHYEKSELSSHGLLKDKAVKSFTQDLIDRYDVRTSGLSQKAGELSGGNIQKLIVAREIEQNSPLLIAAEPTRGVDIGAIEFIHNKLLEKRAKGDAVLLISSELSEIMTLSDRIYVIYEGKIAGEFRRGHVTEEQLGLLMMGGKADGSKEN